MNRVCQWHWRSQNSFETRNGIHQALNTFESETTDVTRY
jgi:hypothetical protein